MLYAATTTTHPETLATAAFLTGLAILFACRQWVERAHRPDDLDELDTEHFRRKDQRRFSGTGLMVLIAALMFASTRIKIVDKPAVRLWTYCWIAVLVLLLVLLFLAFADWAANARYARRHRNALRAEQQEFWRGLASRLRQRHNRNGHS